MCLFCSSSMLNQAMAHTGGSGPAGLQLWRGSICLLWGCKLNTVISGLTKLKLRGIIGLMLSDPGRVKKQLYCFAEYLKTLEPHQWSLLGPSESPTLHSWCHSWWTIQVVTYHNAGLASTFTTAGDGIPGGQQGLRHFFSPPFSPPLHPNYVELTHAFDTIPQVFDSSTHKCQCQYQCQWQ